MEPSEVESKESFGQGLKLARMAGLVERANTANTRSKPLQWEDYEDTMTSSQNEAPAPNAREGANTAGERS